MVDAIHVYGLAIYYNQFQAKIFKLSIDFTKNTTSLHEMVVH